MNLGSNLKRIRKENNLSQEQFADKLGVSRQAVSKWESGLAIPEMDKLILISRMFNLNIDELINQNVKEVNENKQAKNNINKYIDDFLGFITKVVDMFSSMSFKTKIKCLFEQCIIFGVIALILSIIGSIVFMLVQDILMLLPSNVYHVIYNIIHDVYIVFSIILGILLMLHIFKVRYLDYYVILRDDEKSDNIEEDVIEEVNIDKKEEKKNKIYLEKRQEKIIIRDPERAGDKFISLLFRCILFIIKIFVFFVAIMFCCSLIFFTVILVLSFLFVKTGLTFIGALLMIVSAIIVNLVILNILYKFIISKSLKKNLLASFFVIALILFGVGCGVFSIGLVDFEVESYSNIVTEETVIPWNDELEIDWYYDIEYIESDNSDVRIVYEHSKYYDLDIISHDGKFVWFNVYSNYEDTMGLTRSYINDINNKRFVDYSDISIYIYTSRENIEKLNSKLN